MCSHVATECISNSPLKNVRELVTSVSQILPSKHNTVARTTALGISKASWAWWWEKKPTARNCFAPDPTTSRGEQLPTVGATVPSTVPSSTEHLLTNARPLWPGAQPFAQRNKNTKHDICCLPKIMS